LRRAQFFQFANSKVVGGAQHGFGSWLGNLPANKKAARFGGCSDVLASIRQIERDPPTASELS
jgi:hypothetical protein